MNGVTLSRTNDVRTAMAVWYHEGIGKWCTMVISAEDNRSLESRVTHDSRDDAMAFAKAAGYDYEARFRVVSVLTKYMYFSVYAVQPLGKAETSGPLIAQRLPGEGWQYELLVAVERLGAWERPINASSPDDAAAIMSAFKSAAALRDLEAKRSRGSRHLVVVLETVIGDHVVSREAN